MLPTKNSNGRKILENVSLKELTTFKVGGKVEIIAGAGENWDDLVRLTVEKNLHGLENLSLIPGSVGAAPVQNIGAYGVEVASVISFVEIFDRKTAEAKILNKKA